MSVSDRIVHIHIPKTAGTAIRVAFERHFRGTRRVAPHLTDENAAKFAGEDFVLYSGHIGFPTAKHIGGQFITVLRNPIDRIVSTYFFWRELHEKKIEVAQKTILASKYSLEQFLKISDEPQLAEEFSNRSVWQLTHGSSLMQRRTARGLGVTDDQLLKDAIVNLEDFAVVGIQEDLVQFSADLEGAFGIAMEVPKINVTGSRDSLADLPASVFRAAYEWCFLDAQLYMHVCTGLRNRQRASRPAPAMVSNKA